MASTADCLIVGGGVIGCSLALRLAQRGMTPLVVDPGEPGAEASSAAAGILSPQIEAEKPGPLLDLGLLSRARFPRFSEEIGELSGMDVRYRSCGAVMLADADSAAELERRAQWQEACGLRLERLGPEDVRALEPKLGPCAGAILFPEEAQVEAPLLARAALLAALRAGARFQTGRASRVICERGAVTGVIVDGTTISCERAVIAAGSWSSLIEGSLLPPGAVRPVRGQIAEIETRPLPLSVVVFVPGGYFVPRSDGRVLLGSTMDEAGFAKHVTVAGMGEILSRAARYLPAVAEAPISRLWAGLRPATRDGLPYLGKTPVSGLFLATGHFRKGILLSAITADAMAAAVLGDPSPVDLTPYSVTR